MIVKAIISEYYFRPVIPPPFISIAHIGRIVRATCCRPEVDEKVETKSTKTYFAQVGFQLYSLKNDQQN